jgi:hypothetical protein
VTIRETYMRYFQLLLRHGTEEEQAAARETMEIMTLAKEQHPEGSWEPLDYVILPEALVERAKGLAKHRQNLARQFKLHNQHGVVRDIEDERRSVEGQYAAALMLGLPFGDRLTHQSANAHGNLGENCSAFVPSPGNFNLLIREKEKRRRHVFLILHDGGHSYRCAGWCRAGEYMLPEYQIEFVRNGVKAHPFLVPPDYLSPIRTWWSE